MNDIAALGLRVDSGGVIAGTRHLERFEGQARRTEGAAERMGRSIVRAAGAFAAMAAATTGFTAVISTLSGFETSMAAVAAITRATDEELKQLRDTAKQLGATTEFSASQAADALKFLGMAGFQTADAISAIPAVLDLATAAQMDLARAADISSNIMSAFGIAATDAAKVADVLAAASSRANTDVTQLGDGMKYVGPIASALGIAMSDTAAAMGILSDAGLQGSMAGTGLRQILAGLANTTPQAAKALQSLGLDVEKLNPATTSLVDIIAQLKDAGLDAATALTVFGDRGAPAVLALIEGAQKLGTLTDELKNVNGEAKRMAETMRDQLGGDLKGLSSALEGLIIQMGESGLISGIRGLVQGLTTLVREFTAVIGMVSEFSVKIDDAIGFSETFGRAIDFIGGAMGDARGYIIAAAVGTALYFTPAMIGATASVVGLVFQLGFLKGALIATGIGAAVVAAGYLINKFIELSEAVGGFGNAFVYVKELGLEVLERIQMGGGALVEGYKAYTAGFVLLWQQTFATVLNLFGDFIDTILDGTRNSMLGVGNIAGAAAIEASRAAIKSTLGQMQEGANAAVETQKALVSEHAKNAQQMAQDALAPLYMWQAWNAVLDAAGQKTAAMANSGAPAVPPGLEDILGGGAGGSGAAQIRDLTKELYDLDVSLTREAENLARAQKGAESIADIENEIRKGSAGGTDVLSETDSTRSRERFEGLETDLIQGVDNPILRLEAQYKQQQEIHAAFNAKTEDEVARHNAALIAMDQQYAEAKLRLQLSSGEQAAGALASSFQQMFGEQSAAYKMMFGIQQAFVIATASLNIAKAMSEALALPFPANLAAWGTVLTNAATIMSAVNSVALGFQSGGYTGSGGVSQVAGVVHGQEFVAHAEATRRWRPQLEAMNAGTYRPANDNGGGGTVNVNVTVSVDDDGRIVAYVRKAQGQAVNAAVSIAGQQTKAMMGQAREEANRPRISARG